MSETATELIGFVCGPSVYEWGGFTFEVHSYFGPWPLRKDGEPMARASKRFWEAMSKFEALSSDEQKRYRVVEGGCRPIYRKVMA